MEKLEEKLIEIIKNNFINMPKMIDHTLKVLNYAKDIAISSNIYSGFIKHVIILGSLLHDIGIPASIAKYSSSEPIYQQREGNKLAKKILPKQGIRKDIMERVLYIIRHHHEPEKIDGIDFQIIYEADTIVNIIEKNIDLSKTGESLLEFIAKNFKTNKGKEIIKEIIYK